MLNCWIVPCNIKYFDVVTHFKKNSTVVWKNISHVQPGDTVYIYLGAPHKELQDEPVSVLDRVRVLLVSPTVTIPLDTRIPVLTGYI